MVKIADSVAAPIVAPGPDHHDITTHSDEEKPDEDAVFDGIDSMNPEQFSDSSSEPWNCKSRAVSHRC